MRKLLMIVFFAGLLVLVGCSSLPPPMFERASNQAQSIGRAALSIADEFLDREITARRAHERILGLSAIDTEGNTFNKSIDTRVFILGLGLSRYAWESSSENFDDILNSRNRLAEGFGIEER